MRQGPTPRFRPPPPVDDSKGILVRVAQPECFIVTRSIDDPVTSPVELAKTNVKGKTRRGLSGKWSSVLRLMLRLMQQAGV
jgi:hypothetical protein